jgi:hypothetical protein
VHCVRVANDGLVYVCARANDRIQVFRKDGTFVQEFRVEPHTLQNGSVWDLVLSTDTQQRFVFMADGANNQVVTLVRDSGEVVASWGRGGRMAGQFKWVHGIAIDSKGNLYTDESAMAAGRRSSPGPIEDSGFWLGCIHIVMAGLVPAIHALLAESKDVDARHKAGHDESTVDAAALAWRRRPHKKVPGSWGGRGFPDGGSGGDRVPSSTAVGAA